MDIIVKSFNRVYLLDRCISSIYEFIQNFDGKIVVIDDGTPKKYLDKLRLKYPDVVIEKTDFYEVKSNYIEGKQEEFEKRIPIESWLKTVRDSSDYFLLIEDDMWITNTINWSNIKDFIKVERPLLLKLFWLGNNELIASKKELTKDNYVIYQPKLISKSLFVFKLFSFDRFKFRLFTEFIGLYSLQNKLNYYSIYSVAGAFFKKEYFLNLWNDNYGNVNEDLQLRNALKFIKRHNKSIFARFREETLKTSFISSATNFSRGYDKEFDMFAFNKILNDAWYEDLTSFNRDYSRDISAQIIEKTLSSMDVSIVFIEKWKVWMESFKNQYKNIGCLVN